MRLIQSLITGIWLSLSPPLLANSGLNIPAVIIFDGVPIYKKETSQIATDHLPYGKRVKVIERNRFRAYIQYQEYLFDPSSKKTGWVTIDYLSAMNQHQSDQMAMLRCDASSCFYIRRQFFACRENSKGDIDHYYFTRLSLSVSGVKHDGEISEGGIECDMKASIQQGDQISMAQARDSVRYGIFDDEEVIVKMTLKIPVDSAVDDVQIKELNCGIISQ